MKGTGHSFVALLAVRKAACGGAPGEPVHRRPPRHEGRGELP